MLRIIRYLFSILIFLPFFVCSQNTFDELIEQDLYANQRWIVNGVAWTNSSSYKGNRFCGSSKWKLGEVVFNGKEYFSVWINYDVLEQELILYDEKPGSEKYIKLNRQLIESFSYEDQGETKMFVVEELVPGNGTQIYEKVQSGAISFYIKYRKSVKNEIQGDYLGKIINNNIYYLVDEQGVHAFKNKKQVLDILGNTKALKKYIRKENLVINRKKPEDIVRLLVYNELLTPTQQR
ncbi:hypothetical protein OU798_20655 [Prolixibacteraceae bacterium Z1-6]|uniref:Uncharacterized protein n=1 Tax=Draconibacterium aestuarii TaxID=2998507 RepID=A0A9X3J7S3_9BACT|nr:hypothetical protein [Prolixibacteraceae bacterium Z1-6]